VRCKLIDGTLLDLGSHGSSIRSAFWPVADMAGNQPATTEANMSDAFRCLERL